MIKLGDNRKTNKFFDKYNMMLERSECNDHHIGDALWRTVLAWAASRLTELEEAIKSCVIVVENRYNSVRIVI